MRKKGLSFIPVVVSGIILFLAAAISVSAAERQTIYNSRYVDFAPDGKAWTTNAGDREYEWYAKDTMVSTGIFSSMRELQNGEHYYIYERTGEIPIGSWKVELKGVNCCHNDYPSETNPVFHGVQYERNNCFQRHYSGWNPYCADCGEKLQTSLIYMSREAAESIDYFEIGTGMDYYYLCPFCSNLEQGVGFDGHDCKAISWNQYKVNYDENTNGLPYGGYMPASYHMYNNATEYEGKPVTPITHLTKNAYTRVGYEFVEWNMKPDGSGQSFQDGQEILNLTDQDLKENGAAGEVTLYAQWRKSSGTLNIDPNGGTYDGKTSVTVITGSFGNNYRFMNETIRPPRGFTVSFHTNGGSEVDAITSTRYFAEWSMVHPFNGIIKNNLYYFIAPDGNTDTVVANYGLNSITLPSTSKPDSSFGGWYYDPECTEPAGGPGDKITPSRDITLYADWVDLKLFSRDNYTVNGGKGAVDLSWSQSDSNSKTYKVYQSRDNATWKLITSASDIGNQTAVSQTFHYTGSSKSYTVPYTGIYTLTAYGAQGDNYGSYQGGYGGSVTARVWLRKGEIITYTIGGQNGYNGGGVGSVYGNGGGATTIVSNRQGTLLIAGGGGGASASGNGGAGGSATSLRVDNNSAGVSGQTGGGAGKTGGNAGEYVVHTHTEECMHSDLLDYIWFYDADGYVPDYLSPEAEAYYNKVTATVSWLAESHRDWQNGLNLGNAFGDDIHSPDKWFLGTSGYNYSSAHVDVGYVYDYDKGKILSYDYIPTKGNTEVFISANASISERKLSNLDQNQTCLIVYDQNNQEIYRKTAYALELLENEKFGGNFFYHSGYAGEHYKGTISGKCNMEFTYSTDGVLAWNEKIPLPEGTTGIRIVCQIVSKKETFHISAAIECVEFSGGENVYPVCGYESGQILSSKPAYGGSSYINTSAAYEYSQSAGMRPGNGAFTLQSQAVGYLDVLSLKDVVATDFAVPDSILAESVTKEALEGNQVKISWQAPKDNGTDYYHVAESYLAGGTAPLCRSNVAKNTLISGIKGYYVRTDTNETTTVNASNASFVTGTSCVMTIGEQVKYLHVAAVDKAGNISSTVHIKVEAQNIPWRLYTEPLFIKEGENVSVAGEDQTWYVRADGRTPFTLQHNSYMDGPATAGYQPNYIIYESVCEAVAARNIVYTPSTAIQDGVLRTDADGLSHSAEGRTMLIQYPYSYTLRSNLGRRLRGEQSFTLEAADAGKEIEIIPIVGADRGKEIIYSNHDEDKHNSLSIVGDGEAPIISGLEILENAELINRNAGMLILNVTATDDLSGVKEFYVEVTNTDNANCKTYTPGADGSIRIEITKDEPIFGGDFRVLAYAVDNVGNEREMRYATTEFALSVTLERILEPHDPVFKCGESGVLHISTYGYAEKVEVVFPPEMVMLQPGLNQTFDYSGNENYLQQEELRFMIPLYTPANTRYTITIRAYKGDKRLEEHPTLSTIAVEGSVLDELRTRLR